MTQPADNEPVLRPSELLAYRRANGQLPDFRPPHTVIFVPQKSLANHVLRRYWTQKIKGFLGEVHLLRRSKGQIAISSGFGIGAPVVAGLADEFAALGVRQFALLGMAGALQPELSPGSLVLSTQSIRGEGVSRHYVSPGSLTVDSSGELVRGFSEFLTQRSLPHRLGTTWTTDAPFREMRLDVLEHQRKGVLAVDMEAAALLAVASATGVPAFVAFSIADQLSDGHWRMANDLRPAQKGLIFLFDSLYDFLTNRLHR